MRALWFALLVAFAPGWARAARVVTPTQQPRTPTQGRTAPVAPVQLKQSPLSLTQPSLTGTLGGLIGAPSVNIAPGSVDFFKAAPAQIRFQAPQQPIPELPASAAMESSAFLEQAAFHQGLPRRLPPEPPALRGNSFASMARQSAVLSVRGQAVTAELSRAAQMSAGGAESAQRFGDRVWDALLGATRNAPERGELSASARSFASLSPANNALPDVRRDGSLPLAASRRHAARSVGAAPRPGTAAVELLAPWTRLGLGPAAAQRGTRPALLVLSVSRRALAVSYAEGPARRLAGVLAVSLLAESSRPSPASRSVVRVSVDASVRAPSAAPVALTATVARARPSASAELKAGAELDRFTYLQAAGQALAELPAPPGSAAADASAPAGLPLWAFPASALLPFLALVLLTRREG